MYLYSLNKLDQPMQAYVGLPIYLMPFHKNQITIVLTIHPSNHRCVCVTGGYRKCIDLQPNAAASLNDDDCGPQKGRLVRWLP